jgi:hypothetical protein
MQTKVFQGGMFIEGRFENDCPVLELKVPNPEITKIKRSSVLKKFIRKAKVSPIGTFDDKHQYTSDNQLLHWKIRGKRNVEEAIYVLLQDLPEEEIGAQNQLEGFRKTIVSAIKERDRLAQKKIPIFAKKLVDYQDPIQEKIDISTHAVKPVSKDNKIYFFKPNYGAITEIESFNAELFRLLLGDDRVAKAWPVYDEDGMRRGVISEKLEGDSIVSYLEKTPGLSWDALINKLIASGYHELGAAESLLRERDAHWRNVIFNHDNLVSRYDFDQSDFPNTCIYLGRDPNSPYQITNKVANTVTTENFNPPNQGFRARAYDIIHWPLTKEIQGHGIYQEFKLRNGLEHLEQIKNNAEGQALKWKIYLIFILLDDNVYRTITEKFFTSRKRKEHYFHECLKKRQEYLEILPEIPAFRKYVRRNPQVIDTIIKHLEKLDIGIQPETIREKFQIIQQRIEYVSYARKIYSRNLYAVNPYWEINYLNNSCIAKIKIAHKYAEILSLALKSFNYTCKETEDKKIYYIEYQNLENLFDNLNKMTISKMANPNILNTLPAAFLAREIKFSASPILAAIKKDLQSDDIAKIINYCFNALNKPSHFYFFKLKKNSDCKLLYKALAEMIENIKFEPKIRTLEDLLYVQRKRMCSIKFEKKADKSISFPILEKNRYPNFHSGFNNAERSKVNLNKKELPSDENQISCIV